MRNSLLQLYSLSLTAGSSSSKQSARARERGRKEGRSHSPFIPFRFLNNNRRMDREHYLAALLLPPAARDATFALRAFNIEVAIVRCASLLSPSPLLSLSLVSLRLSISTSSFLLTLPSHHHPLPLPLVCFCCTAIWLSSRLRGICGISSGETSRQRCSLFSLLLSSLIHHRSLRTSLFGLLASRSLCTDPSLLTIALPPPPLFPHSPSLL